MGDGFFPPGWKPRLYGRQDACRYIRKRFLARSRKRQPGRARSPAMSQPCGQWWFWGGRTGQRAVEFLSREGREGGEVAARRDDNSPAIHGWVKRPPNEKVPRGTAEKFFRPCRDFGRLRATSPSHEWLGYFQGKRARRRKRPPGRARSPAKSQPGGQWQFEVDERGKRRLIVAERRNDNSQWKFFRKNLAAIQERRA